MNYTDRRFDTVFPKKQDQDITTYRQLLHEKYRMRFPQVEYFSLLIPQTVAVDNISSDTGKTVVDDLWGEALPQEDMNGFIQPHSSNSIDINTRKLFEPSFKVNIKILYSPKQQNQKRQGQDWTHELQIRFLLYQMETLNKVIKIGDEFIWKDARYQINRFELAGRWMDTDVFLYCNTWVTPSQIGS